LHEGSGLLAVREAGLWEEFSALARYDDQSDAIYDHHGALRFEHTGAGGDRPEIDRTQLRDMLLASLPRETVRWGTKVSAVTTLPDGRFLVGDEAFSLVVGADGAWSKVRPLLTNQKPRYVGVTFVELSVDDVDAKHPEVAKLVPRGKVSAAGGGHGLIAQRSSNAHVRTYCMFRVPEGWTLGDDPKRALKALLAGWSPKLLSLIDAANDHVVIRPIVTMPVGHRWTHRPGLTLLGDAAHVMPPFSGEGVNIAMLDATDLALSLAGSADWNRAVAEFEERMFARAAEAAAGAIEGLAFVSERGLDHVLEHFAAMG